jgi:type VI secretion system protein VasG
MMQVDLKSLIARLSPSLKAALESSAATAMSNGHYTVEVEHWLLKILDSEQSDLAEVLKLEGINPQEAKRQLENAVQEFKGGNSRAPSLSPLLVDCAKSAWLLASVNHGLGQTLSSHLLAAVLSDDIARRQLPEGAQCRTRDQASWRNHW